MKHRLIKKWGRIGFMFLLFCLAANPAQGGDSPYLGYTGYLQGSSKVIGMAGAFTGVANDVNGIIYNPAGSIFNDFRNLASFNYVLFTDRSLDLDKESDEDIWKSAAFSFGYLHRTKKASKFTWGIYFYNFYELKFTSDLEANDKFFLPLDDTGTDYDAKFGLGGFIVPLIWQLGPKISLGINARLLSAAISYEDSDVSLSQNRDTLLFDVSTMYKIRDNLTFGALLRPPVFFDFDDGMNDQLDGLNWFDDVRTPLEINIGLGYKLKDRLTLGFDLHYAQFQGDEILVGSNLTPRLSEYKLRSDSVLSPHIGAEYKTSLWNRDLFLRGGYYHQPSLFYGLPSKDHYTFSFSWRVIKLPDYLVIKHISLGYSKDMAPDFDVQTLSLDISF